LKPKGEKSEGEKSEREEFGRKKSWDKKGRPNTISAAQRKKSTTLGGASESSDQYDFGRIWGARTTYSARKNI